MLFSSWPFIAAFLPVTWAGFKLLQKHANREISLLWLVSTSLLFYGWFKPVYLFIVLVSMACNYALGMMLAQKPWPQKKRLRLLIFGITANLAALFYYKYTGLFFRTLNMAGAQLEIPDIILPLGISFFTFQKIAWLVDSYRKETAEPNFLHYALFITFFPQLIAGPITHHKEILPQFLRTPADGRARRLLAMGITVFIIGLFKKTVIADNMGEIADPIFASASLGNPLTLIESWLGVLSYTLQIYFDFSGYSDMACGLAGMFGVRLPLNFFSPYKAVDIISFWRRWHITLSRFLRDYLYIPLGGNRLGKTRRYINLFITMLLGGLWHGANWTFAVWGGLHGIYLAINHAWRNRARQRLPRPLAVAITFLAVALAWIFFRANSASTALHMISCLTGRYGIALQDTGGAIAKTLRALGVTVKEVGLSRNLRINEKWYIFWLALGLVFAAPNAHELMRGRLALDATGAGGESAEKPRLAWRPSPAWAGGLAVMAAFSLLLLTKVNAFIYFQF
jgi:D-alanyl-lipoteichoic acid acyltransferase DltB (MBOAT superfamily)